MSRYFVVAGNSYSVFEQARAAARASADTAGVPCTVEVHTDGRLTKVYTYQPTPAQPTPAQPTPDAPTLDALTARVEQLEAALAELISAQAQAKPRTRRTKAKAA